MTDQVSVLIAHKLNINYDIKQTEQIICIYFYDSWNIYSFEKYLFEISGLNAEKIAIMPKM